MYAIPVFCIFSGAGMIMWGGSKILNRDNSADIKVKEILLNLPDWVETHLTKFVYKNNKLTIECNFDTTEEQRQEIEEIIMDEINVKLGKNSKI